MEKPVAVLELSNRALKVVVGYVIDGQVYVLYALDSPYQTPCMENGTITDYEALVKEISKIKTISDPSAKLSINIADVVLVLPPYGLEVYESSQITSVVSEQGKVGHIDIKNLNTQIYNQPIPSSNDLVDIVPEQFVLNGGRSYTNAPIDEYSNAIRMSAKVHTLPRHIITDYMGVVKSAGMNVRRHVLAPFGAAELLSSYPGLPTDYILVDIGAKVTTISLIGKNKLYGSTYISWGGENVTEHISSRLGINRDDAEKYKIMYGYDTRKMNFEAPVCTTIDENNIETKHMVSDMNEAIKAELDTFISKYNLAFNELLKDYDPSYKPLPMVLIGGGSQLIGFKEYVEPKVTNDKLYCVIPRSLGARNPAFANVLGVLKVNDKYKSVLDEMRPKITQVTRGVK